MPAEARPVLNHLPKQQYAWHLPSVSDCHEEHHASLIDCMMVSFHDLAESLFNTLSCNVPRNLISQTSTITVCLLSIPVINDISTLYLNFFNDDIIITSLAADIPE
jgi:hypothetical protein